MSDNQNRSFSLLTCSQVEFEKWLEGMLQQEKIERAALKWTRSDIRRVRQIGKERFNLS